MKIELELSEATAEAAQRAGLLQPETLERLLSEELERRDAGQRLLAIADRIAAAGIPAMPLDEVGDVVKAVRTEQRHARGA